MDKKLKTLLPKIASRTLANGGVAFKLDTREFLPPMDIWSFPKYPSRTAILAHDINLVKALEGFIILNEPFLMEADCWLGTWIHPQSQEFYLDIATGCADLDDAMQTALQVSQHDGRQIVAIFNSKRGQTVYL